MDHESDGPEDTLDEWLERAAALPRSAEVVPEQWERISSAIRPLERRPRWWVQIAAAAILFAGGLAGGFAAGSRRAPPPRTVVDRSIDEAMTLAAEVQRTGSEYVAALAAFTAVVDSLSADVRTQGRDAALATLVGAASELVVLADAGPGSRPGSGADAGRVRF